MLLLLCVVAAGIRLLLCVVDCSPFTCDNMQFFCLLLLLLLLVVVVVVLCCVAFVVVLCL